MYFDPIRNAYIDSDTGVVVLQESSDYISDSDYLRNIRSPSLNNNSFTPTRPLFPSSSQKYSTRITPNYEHLSQSYPEIAHAEIYDNESQIYNLNPDLYTVETANAQIVPNNNVAITNNIHHFYDDWTLARTLQALEFEISNEEIAAEAIEGDFNAKEYKASRSCRRQMITFSFLICLIQISFMVAMIEIAGYSKHNPVIGPPVYIMVRFGAKETALIVDCNQWWRLLSAIFVHGGIFHLIPNVAVQLRVGGYLELVYGHYKWLFIYLISGIFGEMMSCIFIPNSVGVGSSGALMGMLCSWIVWIIFRWKKIPTRMKSQRNCQLIIVMVSVVVTLATSFTPNVDWAAHIGGSIQGILWGIVLLSSELDHERNQLWLRISASVLAIGLYAYSLYYMIAILNPSTENLDYFEENDDWNRN